MNAKTARTLILVWIGCCAAAAFATTKQDRPGWLGFECVRSTGTPMKGLQVTDVSAKGPAEAAGLLPGDLIVSMQGKIAAFRDDAEVREALGRVHAGETLTLNVLRKDVLRIVKVVAVEKKN